MKRILVAMATLSVATGAFAQISEAFDDVLGLQTGGAWNFQNLSNPVGSIDWFQGNVAVFPPQASVGYVGANFNSTAGIGTISNWMITPEITLNNGALWSFWTRTVLGSAFPDRLHFKMSTNGGSTNVADFTTVLVSINPNLTVGGYDEEWTQYSGNLSGLGGPTQGRLAFHYDVTNGGPDGANSNYIGVDTFDYNPVPEPATIAVLALGLGALVARRRKA